MIEVEHWVPREQESWESEPEADDIWLRLADGQLRSWCGCAEPGKAVLACGHCRCGNSDLCWEWIVERGSDQLVVKRRKASCV